MFAHVGDREAFQRLKVIGIRRFESSLAVGICPLLVRLPSGGDRYAVWDQPGAPPMPEPAEHAFQRFADGHILDLPGGRAYRAVRVSHRFVMALLDTPGEATEVSRAFCVGPTFGGYAYDDALRAYYLVCGDQAQAEAARNVWVTFIESAITLLLARKEPAWTRLRVLISCLGLVGGWHPSQRRNLDALDRAVRRIKCPLQEQEEASHRERHVDATYYPDPADRARMMRLATQYEQVLRDVWGEPARCCIMNEGGCAEGVATDQAAVRIDTLETLS